MYLCFFFFSSRRRHTRLQGDWSSDVALPIFAPCARGRSGGFARASDGSRVLSRHREARGSGAELGVPGGTPRLRVPVGARAVGGGGGGGVAGVHGAAGGRHSGHGRQDRSAAPHAASGRSHCAWLHAPARRPCAGSTGGGPARVSGAPQGGRGGRRQGYAVGTRRSRARGGIRGGVERSAQGGRGGWKLSREIPRAAAPPRDPDSGGFLPPGGP